LSIRVQFSDAIIDLARSYLTNAPRQFQGANDMTSLDVRLTGGLEMIFQSAVAAPCRRGGDGDQLLNLFVPLHAESSRLLAFEINQNGAL